jgi:hypothetical protein
MFRIMQDPSSGSIDLYLIKTIRIGSPVLVCAVGVWRHIQDLWCVCVCAQARTPQILVSTTSRFERIGRLIKVTYNNDAWWKLEITKDGKWCSHLNLLLCIFTE